MYLFFSYKTETLKQKAFPRISAMVNFSYLEEENGKGEENKKRILGGQFCGIWEASGKEKKEERENNFVL